MAEDVFTVQIKIDVSGVPGARDTAKGALDDIGQSAIELNQALELVKKGFELLKTAVTLPINQFRSLLDVSTDLVEVYDESFLAQTKLLAVIKSTGQGGEEQARKLTELASALQDVTRFEDDAITSGQAFAIGAGVPIDQMERFTLAAVDLAQVLGKDVTQGFRLLNQAVQTGSIRGFKQNISDATDSGVKFNEVLKFVETNLGGIARAAAEGGAGPLEQLKNVFNELEESLGKIVAESPEFRAFVSTAKRGIVELIEFIKSNKKEIADVFGATFRASFQIAVIGAELLLKVLKQVVVAMNLLIDTASQIPGIDIKSPFEDLRRELQSLNETRERLTFGKPGTANVGFQSAQEIEQGVIRIDAAIADVNKRIHDAFSGENIGTGFQDAIGEANVKVNLLIQDLNANGGLLGDPEKAKDAYLQAIEDIKTGATTGGLGADIEQRALGQGANVGGDGASTISETKRALEETTTIYDEFARTIPTTTEQVLGSLHSIAGETTDAIVAVFNGAKVSISDLARSIASDISRILIQTLILKGLQAALGSQLGSGSIFDTGAALPTRASGGTTVPARSYLVGERGPEVFRTNAPGRIESAAAAAPAVNVQVVNVSSMDELHAAINAGRFDRSIVNVLQRQRQAVGRITS